MAKFVTLLTRKGTALFRTVLLMGVLAIAVTVVFSAASQQDKAIEKAISQYLSVASSHYNQGLYDTAKDALESAKSDYGNIFTESQSADIEKLLSKVNAAIEQRVAAEGMLDEGIKAVSAEQFGAAMSLFSQVRDNKFASSAQRDEAVTRIKAIETRIEENAAAMKAVFDQSYEQYKQGNYQAAKAGFTQVQNSGVKISRWFGSQDSAYFLAQIEKAEAAPQSPQASDEAKAAEQAAKEAADKAAAEEKARLELEAKAAADAEKAAKEQAAAELKAQKDAEKAALEAQKASEAQYKAQMQELFDASFNNYKAGNLVEAKEGFAAVAASGAGISYMFGRDSAYYINKIDAQLAKEAEAAVKAQEQAAADAAAAVEKEAQKQAQDIAANQQTAESDQAVAQTQAAAVVEAVAQETAPAEAAAQQAEPQLKENSYVRVVQEKRDRQRDYTSAIVADSVKKANDAVVKGDYAGAKGSLTVAYSNIDKTKMLLGDELYNQYKTQLDQLTAQIEDAQSKAAAEQERVKRTETEELQATIRSNVEAQRERAVADYLANAAAFQKEQRYKEALAQLEALLAIDPLNSVALLQKETIEQTIIWREQVAIQKEKHQQEIQTLLNSDRAGIPYSDEMTYPKTWKEIVAKRQAQQDDNLSPEDMSVYRALQQTVDLTSFYEDMTFGEAIEILANSMDPPATIVVVWTDLDQNAFVDKNTPINLTIPAPIKAELGLNLLLTSVAGGLADISYVVKDGVIRIATAESLPDKMVVRKYVVTELLSPAAEFNFDMDTTDYGNQGSGRSAGGGGGGSGSNTRSTTEDDDDDDRETLRTEAMGRASAIIQLIQEAIDPSSWYNAGGEGTLTTYSNNVLVIRQTLENHKKIRELIDDLRSSLGEQVAIETRFLTVTENFLEEIGLDLDMVINPKDSNWNEIVLDQDSVTGSKTNSTGVPGSLAGSEVLGSAVSGGYILDDLQVSFMLKATQAHKDSKDLNAPKVTVLSGESAAIRVEKEFNYVADYEFEDLTTSSTTNVVSRTIADPEISTIRDGVVLNVTPTITADKKYVLLRIMTSYTKTHFETYLIPPTGTQSTSTQMYEIQLPISQIADVRTRVTVPDGGTLLIGGQKLTGEQNTEVGTPVLSKIPVLGRLFENRSKVKDNSILLILVKPTIILQDEQERNAVAAMESVY